MSPPPAALVSPLAHGLAGELVAPAVPGLTDAELRPLLAGYPAAGGACTMVWHSQRPFATSAIVQAGQGRVFVKRHDARLRTVDDLREEHAFIAHLRAGGGEVPAVLADRHGRTALPGSGVTYEVHALGEGLDLYRDAHSWTPARSTADAAAIGQALGRLHVAAAGFGAPVRRTHLLVAGQALIAAPDLVAALRARLADDALLADALAGRDWEADVARHLAAWHAAAWRELREAEPLWVHGDAHASNLLWRDGRVSAVLDFGLANRASAVFDLATAIERNAIEWLRLAPGSTAIGRADLARALVRGYAQAADMPVGLRHVLPVVHVDFALSELAYFHGVTRCAGDAEAAYSNFLLGHAAWFGSLDGREFLAQLD